MATPLAIGIDLGTTMSAVAWVQADGRTAMVKNSEGEILTPSVVLFEDHDIIAGKEARKGGILKPNRVAETVKRDMGSAVYSQPIRGEYLPPEVIQACILRKLKADAVKQLGGNPRFVITVPAFFDEPRRRSTAQAAEMADLEILDIVNEPTAAALAFGEQLGYLHPDGTARKKLRVLVYDLGGGTFDVTLVEIEPGAFRTVATDGDVRLGGHDWDMRLVNHVAEEFLKQHKEDPRENPSSLKRLLYEVEEAKHALSARQRAIIRVEHAGRWSEIPVKRETFEEITADLLERTAHTTRQVLSAAGKTWAEVDHVLMVGGSTRMPMVARLIEQLTGKAPDHGVHPDEAVARGAAIYAHYLLSQQGATTAPAAAFSVTDVNAHSLGIEGIDSSTMRKRNVVLIPRNTPLPARVTDKFVTKQDNQPSVVVQVLEGESSMPSECAAIGRTVIRDLPKLPKGAPIEVTYEYATNGRLNVRAVVSGTGREVSLELERDEALSNARVQQWNRVLQQPEVGVSDFDDLDDLINQVMSEEDQPPTRSVARSAAEPVKSTAAPAIATLPKVAASQPAPPVMAIAPAKSVAAAAPVDVARPASIPTATKPVFTPVVEKPSSAPVANVPPRAFKLAPVEEDSAMGRVAGFAGHVIFAMLGLAIGYYVLCWLDPAKFNHFNLPVPGAKVSTESPK